MNVILSARARYVKGNPKTLWMQDVAHPNRWGSCGEVRRWDPVVPERRVVGTPGSRVPVG